MDKSKITVILKNIINNYINGKFNSKNTVLELVKNIDPEDIYNFDIDPMITDCYFAIKHLTEEGFETTIAEINYFKECFNGLRKYNLDDKNTYILENKKQTFNEIS